MAPETLQAAFQALIAVGIILTAVGGYGSWHYSQEIDDRKVLEQKESLKEINTTLALLKTNTSQMAMAQQEKIAQVLSNTEAMQQALLKTTFPNGYAVLDVRGNDWFVLPRVQKGIVKWDETKILQVAQDRISIALPTWTMEGNNRLSAATVILSRRPGSELFPVAMFGYEIGARILSDSGDSTQIAVGIRPSKQ